MMRNEAGGRILPPQIPQKGPKIWRFPPDNLKIWVDAREYLRIIQTANHPPFTKVTLALAWFSEADLGRLRNHSIAMGTAHNELHWGKLLWKHLWIDHMYYFAKKWRFLSKFSCFAMEGSQRRLKRMLRGPKPPPGETRGASGCGQPHHG